MATSGRRELKYRLTAPAYGAVRVAVRRFMRLDGFSTRAPGRRYPVRSLYLDTPGCNAYLEKMDGERSRVKLRIRAYGRSPAATPFISVELKCRDGDVVEKHATRVSCEAYVRFQATGAWTDPEDHDLDPVLTEFERLRRRGHQRPTVLIDYEREAYVPRGPEPLRVTFDHRVRAAHADRLFPKTARFRAAAPHNVVLEIKTPGPLPRWLEHAIVSHGLQALPNSKYTQGIERAYAPILYL